MANLSQLKSEISLIKDLGKITGAMELVSTAKLNVISKRAGNIKTYAKEIYDVFNFIISHSEESAYLKKPGQEIKKTLWVVITSNLGLCGAYNSNIIKFVKPLIKQNDEIICIGNKIHKFSLARNIKVKKFINNIDVNYSHDQAKELSIEILESYKKNEYDSIKIVYTKIVNNMTFEPEQITLFPIEKQNDEVESNVQITLEPDPETVLETSVLLYMNTILFGSIIESQISEHGSRRIAMESASKNGKELSEKLSIIFNRKRQEGITQEISEIVGGANAQAE